MPKNSNLKILRRWKDLDRELCQPGGVELSDFRKGRNVSLKTLLKDLKMFKGLGQGMHLSRIGNEYHWRYYHDTFALFTENLPTWMLKRLLSRKGEQSKYRKRK